MWQVDPAFRVQFWFSVRGPLYVPLGMSKFDFGPIFMYEIL
jgi:hypothetical protein